MGHSNAAGTYHLHAFSACSYDKTIISEDHLACKSDVNCRGKPLDYTLSVAPDVK